ncbi:MAG TPA: MauE/DoxX family redox-associated membrane protein, partial [Acidobacteriota bacterium]
MKKVSPWPDRLARLLTAAPLQALCRLVLGGIFVYASLDKIAHPGEFARIIANYAILPDFLVTLPALALPWVELVAGLCLVAGLWPRSSALLLSLLLLLFMAALGINALRGVSMSCGCFSTSAADTEKAYVLVIRDLLILVPGLIIIFFGRERGGIRT